MTFDQLTEQEHFVVITEFDATESLAKRFDTDRGGQLVHEPSLVQLSTRQAAESRAHGFAGRLGRTRIARLVFEDDTNTKQGESQ